MRTLALAALLVPGLAAADNHFLLELEAGLARPIGLDAESDLGSAYGGTFGFGGRIPGFAPAYYLVGRVAHSSFSFVGAPRVGKPDVDHGELEVAVGGRVYLPVAERLRLVFQLALGETFGETEIKREGTRELLAETETFTVFGEVGAQYRVTEHFSLGAAADASYLPDRDAFNVVKTAAGLDDDGVGRLRLSLTTTFHF